MKNFALKSWWIMNFVSFMFIICSIWIGNVENTLPTVFSVGIVLFLSSQILLIPVSTFLKKEDEIDEAWEKYRSKERELDKLVEFLKTKAFRSTIVTREEIYKHMKWKDDEGRNQ